MNFLSRLAAVRTLISKVVALSSPYFKSEERWKARGLLASIIVLNLGAVYLAVLFNDWNRVFYDALQNKDQPVFWQQLGRFTLLAFTSIIVAVYKFYLTQLLEMRWRSWMTRQYLQRWLDHHAFYKLELARFTRTDGTMPDNPDQRIQDDINQFTAATVSLTMGLLNATVTLASFVGILWALSGGFSFNVGGSTYEIAGYMVWMAVLYCGVGSVLTHYIGRPQIALNFQQQKVEADFRHHLIRVREYSEAIALDRGEKVEGHQLDLRFTSVLANYLRLLKAQKSLIWFTAFFGQAALIFPFLVAAPRFFSGAIQLGELMQIASAFDKVQGSLSWFVDNYSALAAWRATTDRLTSFDEGIQAVALADTAQSAINSVATENAVSASDLTLALPGGAVLLRDATLTARPGDTILLQGPSGSGKSTLFRALAGIWPHAKGQIRLPADFTAQAMFLPQRPYIPNGRLRDALSYPAPADTYSDAALVQALQEAQLPALATQLDQEDAWGQKLSGGEQQRLALARVLLRKPRWVFADESTSALDEPTEKLLYQQLLAHVRSVQGTLVSIAHRPAVAAFHDQRWTMQPAAEGQGARFSLQVSAAQS